jgi:hypothetical protein
VLYFPRHQLRARSPGGFSSQDCFEQDETKALASLVKRDLDQLHFSAYCSDGGVLESDDAEAILAFDNPRHRSIQSLSIPVHSAHERARLQTDA